MLVVPGSKYFSNCHNGRLLQQCWKDWHLIICILIQVSPFVVGACLYLNNSATISFVFINTNLMLISQPLAITQKASAYHVTLSVTVASLSLAAYLYILTTQRLKRSRRNLNLSRGQKDRCLEMRLLCFSLIEFVVFVLNCIISIMLSVFAEQHGSTVVKEIWALGTDLMCLVSPWGLIITSNTVRQLVFGLRSGE
ncbi:unnamed protein product [Gongylonema pulchrum]|uniref:Serpentine receptor class gamma n=1 Tax=Gongylonema pulchrum TaxID=637853 RepID=A0A183ENX6_9BILA|nr:unnamed protein product [Gongylonema pulchrum]